MGPSRPQVLHQSSDRPTMKCPNCVVGDRRPGRSRLLPTDGAPLLAGQSVRLLGRHAAPPQSYRAVGGQAGTRIVGCFAEPSGRLAAVGWFGELPSAGLVRSAASVMTSGRT